MWQKFKFLDFIELFNHYQSSLTPRIRDNCNHGNHNHCDFNRYDHTSILCAISYLRNPPRLMFSCKFSRKPNIIRIHTFLRESYDCNLLHLSRFHENNLDKTSSLLRTINWQRKHPTKFRLFYYFQLWRCLKDFFLSILCCCLSLSYYLHSFLHHGIRPYNPNSTKFY